MRNVCYIAGLGMVVLNMEGDPVGRFYLSEFDDVRYFMDDRLYTLYHHPLGHTIRVYQIALE